jgi:predicted AAA+ superfamily ATPase
LENLKKFLQPNKVVVVYGPRRCGKTTLIKKFLETAGEPYLFVTGEDITVREYLESQSLEKLKSFVGNNRLLVIDEAQKVRDIGLNLKLIIDNVDGMKIIATGSSSFDLARHVGEPLTGRKFTLHLYPLSQMEISGVENVHDTRANLEIRLLYGSYPEVVTTSGKDEKEAYLKDLVGSYLYKDILELDGVKHSDKLIKLLQLLAFQIGKDVSFTEIGAQIGMSKNTAEKYLNLLEQTFVIFRLRGFSRNLRKEISKNSRYFFYDVGVRNMLVNNFNPLALRNDAGMLWENYCIAERLKKQEYRRISSNNYFWRTYEQSEIDFIEDRGGKLYAYEMKWSSKKIPSAPAAWKKSYPEAEFLTVTPENYSEFIL